jgi:hypothetical protein
MTIFLIRMRYTAAILAASCLLLGTADGQAAGLITERLGPIPLPAGVTNAPDWFAVGERLDYKLVWGVIPVGKASLTTDWVDTGDRILLRITALARTTSLVRALFPVDDRVESIVDPATMLPVQYTQILNEGRKHRNDRIVFDHAAKRAVWRDDMSDKAHILLISEDTRDLLAFTYHMRSKAYDIGTREVTDVIVDEKLYELTLTGLKRQRVKIKGFKEKFSCLVVRPEAKFGEIFMRKGKINMWFTTDDRRLCAKIYAFLPFADFKACLRSFKQTYGPVTELPKVDIMYDLLEREGLAVYEADRSIKVQRREHQATDAEETAEAAEADAEAKEQAEEKVHPQRHSPSAPFASDGK